MAYSLAAFIAKEELLRTAVESSRSARVITLTQGYGLMPNTDALRAEAESRLSRDRDYKEMREFAELSPALIGFAVQISSRGMVAYVESELWAGVGVKASIVWEYSAIRMKPYHIDTEWDDVKLRKQPINRALRLLGVERGSDIDEFAALGLGRHRSTVLWVTSD